MFYVHALRNKNIDVNLGGKSNKMAPIEGTFSAKQVYPLFVPLYFGFAPDVYLYVYISLCLLDIKESE